MCARIKLSTNVSADMFSLNIVRGAVPRELVTHVEHKNALLGYGPCGRLRYHKVPGTMATPRGN